MKLQDRYNRTSLITTAITIILAGIVYFYTVTAILTHQVDKDLVVEEHEIFDYVALNHKLPQVFKSKDLQIDFTAVGQQPITRQFINTTFYNAKEKEDEAGRGVISSVTVNGQKYQIKIRVSTVETEDLIQIIFVITLCIIVVLILILYIINRFAIKKLWKPFYQTLHQLKLFSVADKNTIQPSDSEIEEFQELNNAAIAMALKATSDYQELKGFIENASHELMTPIAVINSKLDTLIQTEHFSSRQSELLGDVYETVAKLTRLNRAMLLLTKIENKLITDNQTFNAKESIEKAVAQFDEIFTGKAIAVNLQLSDCILVMSKSLFDVLLNNLLSNAVRHNTAGGYIQIQLSANELVIKNTGRPQPLNSGQIFQRFNKSAESEGSGLGLTLSRQICENYGFALNYSFEAPFHIFTVAF